MFQVLEQFFQLRLFLEELLAKGSPINLFPSEFNSDSFRRTRLGQVSTAFWMIKKMRFMFYVDNHIKFFSLNGYAMLLMKNRLTNFSNFIQKIFFDNFQDSAFF